jgi:hypothetical protein
MPKKTRDEFKQAFKTMKKPPRPKNVSGKIKDELEQSILDDNKQDFASKIDEINQLDPAYLVDLVAYKLGKHFEEEGNKLPFWHDRVPRNVLSAAMAKIIPGDLTDPGTKRMMNTSMLNDDVGRIGLLIDRDPQGAESYLDNVFNDKLKSLLDLAASEGVSSVVIAMAAQLYKRDPDATMQFLLDAKDEATHLKTDALNKSTIAKNQGNDDTKDAEYKEFLRQTKREGEFNGVFPGMLGPDFGKITAKYLLKANTDISLEQLRKIIGNFNPADLRDIANDFPKRFIDEILSEVDTGTRQKLLSDPALRQALQNADKNAWDAFARKVPMLRLFAEVEARRQDDDDSGDVATEQNHNVDAIFDRAMDGDDIKCAYVGTRTIMPSEIMASMQDVDAPRTDCHNMLMVMTATIRAYPGMEGIDLRMKWGHCPNMLMTKKLTDIGVTGRGMIDKTFSGNVFDDAGAATGRILFTGENGVNSHSWLEVGGKAYDPVLGISGTVDAVKDGSTFATFDWALEGLIGSGTGGWYFIKDDPSILKPEKQRLPLAANPMSFNTAYYLTQDPSQHLTPEALQQIGL